MLLAVMVMISLAVRHGLQDPQRRNDEPLLPTFLLAFVGFVVAGSLGLIPERVGSALVEVARGCLVIAIAAVGLKTSPRALRKTGARAVLLLGVETVLLAAFVLAAQRTSVNPARTELPRPIRHRPLDGHRR